MLESARMTHNPLGVPLRICAYLLMPAMAWLWYYCFRHGILTGMGIAVFGALALFLIFLLSCVVLPTRIVITTNALEQYSFLGQAIAIPWNNLAFAYVFGSRETLYPNSTIFRILGLAKTYCFVRFTGETDDGYIQVRLEKRSSGFIQNILMRASRMEISFQDPAETINPREQWNRLLGPRFERHE